MLRQPERRLAALASVVQGDEPSRKLAARLDPPQVRLGDVPTEVEPWPEGGDSIAPYEYVDVSYMIRFQDDSRCRRMRVEPLPDVGRVVRWCERVEHQSFGSRLDECRRDHRLPALARLPVWMRETPDPESCRHFADLDR